MCLQVGEINYFEVILTILYITKDTEATPMVIPLWPFVLFIVRVEATSYQPMKASITYRFDVVFEPLLVALDERPLNLVKAILRRATKWLTTVRIVEVMTERNSTKLMGLQERMYSPPRQIKTMVADNTLHLRVTIGVTLNALLVVA